MGLESLKAIDTSERVGDLTEQGKLERQKEKTNKKLLDYLATEGILTLRSHNEDSDIDAEDVYLYNPTKLEDEEFKKAMHYKSVGLEGTTNRTVSRSLIFSRLGDLKVVVKGKEDEEPITLQETIDTEKIIQEKTIKYLKLQGVISEEEGFLIVDFDQFFDQDAYEKRINKKDIAAGLHRRKQEKRLNYKNLREILGGLKVVSKEDYDKAKKEGRQPEAKTFVNNYESIDDAFSLERKKDGNGYVEPWNFHSKTERGYSFWNYKIKTEDGKEIDSKELYFFKKVFLEGRAERRGKDLFVFNKLTNDFEKINVDWLKENLRSFKGLMFKGVHQFLLDSCPNLRERGLINLDDFKIKSGGPSAHLMREEKPILEKTDVAIDQVRYSVGRSGFPYIDNNIPRENIRVVKLDPNNAGIVVSFEGKEKLLATFPLLTEEEKATKREALIAKDIAKGKGIKPKDITARTIVTVEEILPNVKKWDRRIDNPKLEEETEEEYDKRIEEVGDYGDVNRVTKKFTERCGVGIHNLTWREQQWLTSMNYQLLGNDNKRLVEFGKQYKLEGLKAFLSCELDQDMAYRILDIGEILEDEPETAKQLFAEYARLVDSADKSAEEVSDIYNKIFFEKQVDKPKVIRSMLKKGQFLLKTASDSLSVCQGDERSQLVVNLINDLKREEVTQKAAIKNLSSAAERLNKEYETIYKIYKEIEFNTLVDETLDKELEKGASEPELDDYEAYLRMTKEMEYHPATAMSVNDYEEGLKEKEREEKRFDKIRVEKIHDEIYDFIEKQTEDKDLGSPDYPNFEKLYDLTDKIKQLISFQENLERELDRFVYGEEVILSNQFENIGNVVLQRHRELINQAQKGKDELKDVFKEEREISEEDLDNITRTILEKAKKLVDDYTNKISQGKKINAQEVFNELKNYETSLLLTVSIYKNLAKTDVRPEALRGVEFEKRNATVFKDAAAHELAAISGGELRGVIKDFKDSMTGGEEAEETLHQMIEAYMKNWERYPTAQKILVESFLRKINGPESEMTRLYTYKQTSPENNNKLLSFLRIDDLEKGEQGAKRKYFGSFNTIDAAKGSVVGTALLRQVLSAEGSDSELSAVCVPMEPISSNYIERFGFVVTGIENNYEGTGIPFYKIKREIGGKKTLCRFNENNFKQNDLIDLYEEEFSGNMYQSDAPYFILKFKKEEIKNLVSATDRLTNNGGYIMSRFFERSGNYYCAFERVSSFGKDDARAQINSKTER